MQIARKRFRNRLLVLVFFGVLALLLEQWAHSHSEMFELMAKITISSLLLLAVLAEEFKGRLKVDNIYKASFEDATRVWFVQLFIVLYLLLILIVVLMSINNGINMVVSINSPALIYFFVAPILLVIYIGKYVIEKQQNQVS